MAPVPLQAEDGVLDQLWDAVVDAVEQAIDFLPGLVGALLILLVGWVIGRALAGLTREIVDTTRLDDMVLDTPLGRILGGTEASVSRAFGRVVAWFVYALAVLAAADVLEVELLSEWLDTAVSYLPAFIGGLLVIVVGFVVADFVGDAIANTEAATRTVYTHWFADGVRIFLYFTVIVIGLDTMGIDVSILFVFANALAWGLAAAIAIAVGIAFGWGGKDYVADNLDRWTSHASEEVGGGSSAGTDERDD
jgi:small-conductance mechanosensitive channel